MLMDDVIVYLKLCASYPYLVMMSLFACMGYSSPPSSPPQFGYLAHSQILIFLPPPTPHFYFCTVRYPVNLGSMTRSRLVWVSEENNRNCKRKENNVSQDISRVKRAEGANEAYRAEFE